MHFGDFYVDRERLVLEYDGDQLDLAPKSVAFLAALVERAGEVVSKAEMLDLLWPNSAVDEANLTQHVYVIRKTLRAREPAAAAAIVTVPKLGYRFVAPARARPEPSHSGDATPVTTPPPLAAQGRWPRPWVVPGALVALLTLVASLGTLANFGAARIAPRASTHATPLSAPGAQMARLGRYYLDLRTGTSVRRSRQYFARVIATDPASPTGYAGLADAFSVTADYRFGALPRAAYLQRATALATRAVQLDPRSAEAHASLGAVALFRRERLVAERELRRAIALDAAYAPAHHWLGTLRFDEGDFAGSARELQIAVQSNPVATASSAWLEMASYLMRRYDTTIDYGRRAIELDPTRHDTLRELGLAYAATGRYADAIATFRRIPKGHDLYASVPFLLASVYARAGRPDVARRILGRELKRHAIDSELPFALLALGETREAARITRRLRFSDCRDRRIFTRDPRFDAVRDDAAFATLLRASCRDRV